MKLLSTRPSTRVVGAVGLFIVLAIVEFTVPDDFIPLVSLALVVAPAVNWRAWWRLRGKQQLDELEALAWGSEPSVTLGVAVDRAWYLAVGSTPTAVLGLLTAARILNIVPVLPREVFLLVLSYPPLLAVLPALDTLVTLRRLEREGIVPETPEA